MNTQRRMRRVAPLALCVLLACLWLWPVWVFDGWGWFVTGGPSRR